MTQQSTQFRAVFLAALMVLSVFAGSIAFAGSAAADSHEFTYEGGAVHYYNGSAAVIEVPFNYDVNSSSQTKTNITLLDDDTNVSANITSYSVDNGTLTIVTDDVIRSNDLELDLSSNIQNSTGATLDNAGTKTVSFAAVTLNADEDKNVYKGSKVAVVAENASTDIQVESTDDDIDYFQSGSTGANSSVYVFDTANREVGEYQITYENGSTSNVTVRELGLSVDIDDRTVTDADDSAIEGTVSANAGNRDVELLLIDSSDDEVANQTVELTGQAEYDFEFNASGLDAENYTVEATDLDSGVTTESSSIQVSEAGEGSADFAEGIITEQRGDVAEITVTLEDSDYATVTLGSDDVGFESNVTVEDVNGDGEVTILFDTYAATTAQTDTDISDSASSPFDVPAIEDEDDDDITNANITTGVDSLLEAGEYDIEVRAGESASADSQNVATLVLEERNTTAINSWTAPDGTSFDDLAELQDAVANNNLTQSNDIADGDLAVYQIEASGLEGILNAQEDEDVTTAFFDAANESGNASYSMPYDLTVEQADPGANQDPYEVVLDSSSKTTVWADGQNDTYYVLFDTDANDLTVNGGDIEDGDTLNANFTVFEDEDNFTAVEDGETVEDDLDIVEAEYTVDEPVNVSASGSQTISGETTVAPGTELSLRVRSSGDTQPSFLKTSNVYVDENGTFSGTFDFSEQEVGDTFTFTVSGSPAGSEEYDGNVVESVQTDTSMTTTGPSDTTTEPADTTTEPADTTTEPSDTTTEPSDTTTEAPGTTGGEGDGSSGTQTPGFGVVVALTALLAAALLAIRRD